MFHSARLKLTVWYLLIIMFISLFFSIGIYRTSVDELERGFRRVSARFDQEYRLDPNMPRPILLEPGYLDAAEGRILVILILINIIILGISAGAGYFLAGRTLLPIKQMLDEQNRFITDASHELRTPLTAARTSIEVGLRDKLLTVEQSKELLESNLDDIRTMQELTDDLLYLARSQNTKGSDPETISLKEILQTAIKRVHAIALDKKINLINNAGEFNLTGNKNDLTKVIVILLENAIKYSSSNSEIAISSHKLDGHVQIAVSDQGPGIDKKDIPHIFDRFYRADKSRSKTNIPGYGLGLSIAKKLIEEHHGTISVISEPGNGSTFTMKVPAIAKA